MEDLFKSEDWISSDIDLKYLYSDLEFRKKDILKRNECIMLATLMKPEKDYFRFVIYSNPKYYSRENTGILNITDNECKNILKYKFIDKNNPKNRWQRGIVSARRRVLAHMTFCAGTKVPIAILTFDSAGLVYPEKYRRAELGYPNFDNCSVEDILRSVNACTSSAERTLNSTKKDYLLDKALMLSGEAITFFYSGSENSFLSAYTSLELMARRRFLNNHYDESPKKVDEKWRKEEKPPFIKRLLKEKHIPFNRGSIEKYKDLRDYIGHGGVNITKANKDMRKRAELPNERR